MGNEAKRGVFSDTDSFAVACKGAELLSQSTIIPKIYRGSVPNCLVAIDMAMRQNISPVEFMHKNPEAVFFEYEENPEEKPEEDGEGERIITKDERKTLIQAISERFEGNDEKNRVYKTILSRLGVRSTANMTSTQFSKALKMVEEIASEDEKTQDYQHGEG